MYVEKLNSSWWLFSSTAYVVVSSLSLNIQSFWHFPNVLSYSISHSSQLWLLFLPPFLCVWRQRRDSLDTALCLLFQEWNPCKINIELTQKLKLYINYCGISIIITNWHAILNCLFSWIVFLASAPDETLWGFFVRRQNTFRVELFSILFLLLWWFFLFIHWKKHKYLIIYTLIYAKIPFVST